MNLKNKVTVVTGGAKGIGRELCRRFAEEGARAVVVADLDEVAAQHVANEINGMASACDVARESDVQKLVKRVSEKHGEIDLFCSNAGIMVPGGSKHRTPAGNTLGRSTSWRTYTQRGPCFRAC